MQKVRGVISEESFVKKDGLTILIKEVNFYKKKLIYVRRLTLWQHLGISAFMSNRRMHYLMRRRLKLKIAHLL